MKRILGVLSAVAAALLVVGVAGAVAGGRATDGGTAGGVDTSSAIVLLKGDPLSTYAATRPAPGKKIDFSSAAVKSYRATLAAERNDFNRWLQQNAPAAQVTGQFDVSLNAVAVKLNGTSLDTLRSAPQVANAQYELLYSPMSIPDPDLSLVSAYGAWSAVGGQANGGVITTGPQAGQRIKVGVVDTGIDVNHPCFNATGYPTVAKQGPPDLTNNKVIVAKVFYNKAAVSGLTPKAIQEHGTHVAGTIACDFGLTNSATSVDGVSVPYGVTGVAPGALLGNYNVFPGHVSNARSEDILNALDAAAEDGMDVINMSLGGNSHGIQDLLTMAVDDLDRANIVVAIAAGNEGPGHFTVSSPGSAARALTAGASTAPHFIGVPVTVTGVSGSISAAVGDFGDLTTNVTGPLGVILVNGLPTNACTAGVAGADGAPAAGTLTGKIALIRRGVCTFSQKIRNAQAAGAIAVIVTNSVAGDPIAMGQDGTASQPTIPGVMVARSLRSTLAALNGASTTIGSSKTYFGPTSNGDIMAGFSSQGPTDVDFRVKPDVVAPGVNVLSSVPSADSLTGDAYCAIPPCWAFFQGTSMATPHLAGSAALVRAAHPDWTAAEVRSAIVNTADTGVLKDSTFGVAFGTSAPSGAPVTFPSFIDPNITGAGRENVAQAVGASVALDPVSVSFGAVPSGSGQTKTATVDVTNLTGSGATYALSVTSNGAANGVTYSVSPASITLAAGETKTITITMTAVKGAAADAQANAAMGQPFVGHSATLSVGSAAHAIVYTFIKQ